MNAYPADVVPVEDIHMFPDNLDVLQQEFLTVTTYNTLFVVQVLHMNSAFNVFT